jgi:protoporphyrinogen/coproporphyrinogen III oxidase
MKRVAVIGGGLSGLSAAYQLARDARAEFTLFEASPRLGGIVETVRQDGFVIECGPDSWVTEKPWARALAIELGLEVEIIPSNDRQRRTYLLQNNQLVPMPDGMRMMVPMQLGPIMNSPLFSEEAKIAYQREPERAEELKASALKEGEDESVASFVRRHFGDEVARTIAAPLLGGVFGGDIEALSARAVMPAFVKMERENGSLIQALQSRPDKDDNGLFTSLRLGLSTLINRIAEMLPAGCVRHSDEVIGLTLRKRTWHARTRNAEETFDAVIVATPAHVTRPLLRNVDEGFWDLLAMEATSSIVVALAFTPEQACAVDIPRGFGYLVPQRGGDESQLLACTFVDQKFSDRVPKGGVLLRAFFGGNTATALLNASDDTLAALASRRVADVIGPLPMAHLSVVRRSPLSLPQYAVGHLERMSRLEALVDSLPGLRLVGNAYYGVGLPDMVRMGRDAARRIQLD